ILIQDFYGGLILRQRVKKTTMFVMNTPTELKCSKTENNSKTPELLIELVGCCCINGKLKLLQSLGRMRGAFLLVVDSPSSICISNFQRKSVGKSSTIQILLPASELWSPGQIQREVTSSSGHQRSQATLLLVQWRTSKGQL
ncbi:hypothetical protein L9F63_008542, partial [Diploptera punctata]